MSSQRDHIPGCTGKSPLPSFASARRRAKRLRSRSEAAIAPYRCTHCGLWHLGGQVDRADLKKTRDFKRRRAALKGT